MVNKKKVKPRLIAALLSLIMIMTVCPISVLAAEDLPERIEEKASALKEDISLRDKFSKHYTDPDGKRYAVVFPEQVHYLDQGSWVEVDNRLVFNATAKKYVSENLKFKTQFAQSSGDGKLVSIDDGEHKLSWSVTFGTPEASSKLGAETSKLISDVKAEVSNVSADSGEQLRTVDTISDLGKAESGIRYNKVFNNNVDLRYSVLHGKVEEDVILNSAEGFTSYTLTVETDGLRAERRSDNSVVFLTPDGGEVFKISAPWMKDAAGSVSDDIKVTVVNEKDAALVTYTPSAEWLSDTSRVYPVLIDPSVSSHLYQSNYIDTYVYEGDSASATRPKENTLKVGNISGKKYCAYFKILNIPELVGYSYIEEAKLNFYANKASSPALNIYEVGSYWSPTTITYSNSNQLATNRIASNQTARAVSSYSIYSIDLVDWINNKYEDWGDIYDYFESDEWNGFKLETAANVSGSYTEIYSSENTFQARRPIITIKYAYVHDLALQDGALYSFINKASNKYLTIDTVSVEEGNEDGANVYQYTKKDDTRSQTFKLDYDDASNSFQIVEICSKEGSEWVLEALSSNAFDQTTGEYCGANAEGFYRGYPVQPDQGWIISCYYGDYYRISLKADPNLSLTANGVVDGSPSGDLTTSTGNIYVSKFTGAANQLWKLESGGKQVLNGRDIKDETSIDLSEGATWLDFCCPVYNYGDTVDWHSDNQYVATVDSNGHVTAKKAGKVTISAILYSDESGDGEQWISCTVYVTIPDGVYYLNNVSNDYRLELWDNNSYEENSPLTVYDGVTSEPSTLYSLFKIKHLGYGKYSICSMLDNSMGWCMSGSAAVCSTIGTSDSNVPLKAQWRIGSNAGGYCIYNASEPNKYITSRGDPDEDCEIYLTSYSSSNRLQNWTINKASAQHHGITIKEKKKYLAIGDTLSFKAGIYSSTIGEYGQNSVTWSVANGTGRATIGLYSGIIEGVAEGTITVTATYKIGYQQVSASYDIMIIPLENGRYFFRNQGTWKCLQPDNNGASHMENHKFIGSAEQGWILRYYNDLYYYIINENTNLYLTAPDNDTNGAAIYESELKASSRDRQLWTFTRQSDGTYKVKSKNQANGDKVLAVGWGANTNGINVEQRKPSWDSERKDDWILHMSKDYTLMFLGAEANDPKMPSILSEVEEALRNDAQMDGYGYTSLNKDELIMHLASSSVFSCITHGLQTLILTSDGELTVDDINKLADGALSDLKFAYLGACLTGLGEEGANNLVNALSSKGARTVLGFNYEVAIKETNSWTETFMINLAKGETIKSAMGVADKAIRESGDYNIITITEKTRYIVGSEEDSPCY